MRCGLLLALTLTLGQSAAASDAPTTPNPWLALLPAGESPDVTGWTPRLAARAVRLELERRARGGPPPVVVETEPPGVTGANDAPLVAEPLVGLGTLPGMPRQLLASGWLRPVPAAVAPSTEPDDAIPQARALSLSSGEVAAVPGVIGDGVHGSGGASPSGDFDCVELTVPAGARLELAVVTPEPLAGLDPMVAAWDLGGALLGVADSLPVSGFLTNSDAYLELVAPAVGELVVCALGTSFTPFPPGDLPQFLLQDPFDGGSGPGFGSEGEYDLVIGVDLVDPRDTDSWSVELRVGDALGAACDGGARGVTLRDPSGAVRIASSGIDLSGLQPIVSPLPGGRGGGAAAAVADLAGRWTVEVSGASWFFAPAYGVEVVVARPTLDELPTTRRQRVWLDIDGALVDRALFGLPPSTVELSPLATFLPGWGLTLADQDQLVDRIVAVVDATLRAEIAGLGGNGDARSSGRAGDFDLEVIDSRDGDPWGAPDVARVVVGGSIAELGLTTIGIAEAIDVGNFDTTGTAVVLLDLLSGPASSLNSLNRWAPSDPEARLDLLALGLGRIVAHEAGHLLAAFHTERDLGPTQVMDRGGRLDRLLGVGADGIFGTPDDLPVPFGLDQLTPAEGLGGLQDSLDAISFGDPLAGPRVELAALPGSLDFGALALGDVLDRSVQVAAVGGLATIVTPTVVGPGVFSLPAPGSFGLAAGEVATLEVRFEPVVEGLATAVLSLGSSDPSTPVVDVTLRGVGGVGTPTLDPALLDLGDIEYGPASATLDGAVSLANGGPGQVLVEQLALSGPDSDLFAFEPTAPLTIPAGGTVEIGLVFAPGGLVGPRSTRLIALVSDPSSPRLEVVLTARAHGPDLSVSPPSPYFFGLPRPGETRTRAFRISNLGDRDLLLGSAAISGDDAALFEVLSGPDPPLVAPGNLSTLTVRFAPLEIGDFEALLELPTNDPDENPLAIEMAGEGASGELAVSPVPLHWGAVGIGSSADLVAEMSNAGSLTLLVSATTIEGRDATAFAIVAGGGPFGLTSGSRRDVVLSFAPDRAGAFEAELVVESNQEGLPVQRIALLGRGVGPPTAIDVPAASGWLLVLLAGALALAGAVHLRRAGQPLGPAQE